MATISRRKKKDGSFTYRVEIRLKDKGSVVHQESKSFNDESIAKKWAEKRENELSLPGAVRSIKQKTKTVAEILQWYDDEYREQQEWGRTKTADIKRLMDYDFAKIDVDKLIAADLITHVKERLAGVANNQDKPVQPATAKNDIIWLRKAFKSARPHFPNAGIDLQVIEDASQYCYDHRMIGPSDRRERRPSTKELKILDNHFWKRQHDRRSKIPIHTLFWFAIHSCRRQGEICSLLWEDLNEEDRTCVVRDIKHPRKKSLWRTFKLTPEAWQIIQVQKRSDKRIFPYNAKSVSSAFTNSCEFLLIDNLHFHDLRHEAVSRLFEKKYSIIEVQQFSLHTEWKTLQRYTNLKPGDVITK